MEDHTGPAWGDLLLAAIEVRGDGLTLEPLRVSHADEMADVLADESIYEFIGGGPPDVTALRDRYAAQTVGRSADGRQAYLNWVIRIDASGEAAGYVQATVEPTDDGPVADIAWVVAPRFQGQGVAKRAAAAMSGYLRDSGVTRLDALVHPRHLASQGVAQSVGMRPTNDLADGEVRWTADSPVPSGCG